jgi:hypothetical protein
MPKRIELEPDSAPGVWHLWVTLGSSSIYTQVAWNIYGPRDHTRKRLLDAARPTVHAVLRALRA